MTLAEWLKANNSTDEAFAERAGISRSMVTKLRHRTTKPSFDSARRIVEATGREVTFDDLAPLDPSAPSTAPDPDDLAPPTQQGCSS